MSESKWLKRLSVGAFLIYLLVQLLAPLWQNPQVAKWVENQIQGQVIPLFSAIVSVAGLLVTMVVSTSSLRRTARADLARARVEAAKAMPKIQRIIDDITSAYTAATLTGTADAFYTRVSIVCGEWEKDKILEISGDGLAALDVVKSGQGTRVAKAVSQLHAIPIYLAKMRSGDGRWNFSHNDGQTWSLHVRRDVDQAFTELGRAREVLGSWDGNG